MPFSKKTTNVEKKETVTEAMGISDKADKKIKDTICDMLCSDNDSTISEDLNALSEKFDDNELLYAAFQYGAACGQMRSASSPLSSLTRLMKELKTLAED